MSSHPGCTLKDAVLLAEYIRDIGYNPEQVQDFIPTPGSMATAMYYSGYDPRTMEPVYVPRDPHEKAMQRALLQYRNPQNYDLVHEALVKAERTDLIGHGPKCLIRPSKPKQNTDRDKKPTRRSKSGSKSKANGEKGNSRPVRKTEEKSGAKRNYKGASTGRQSAKKTNKKDN